MIAEFLQHCAEIPYNSVARQLPASYNEPERWGLDCVGFVQLMLACVPEAQPIKGYFKTNKVHVAGLVDHLYVDPFLRMREPLPITGSEAVQTYLEGTVVQASFVEQASLLVVSQVRTGYTLNRYGYNFSGQDMIPDPPISKNLQFVFPHAGDMIFINGIRRAEESPVKLSVGGASPEQADLLLQEKFSLDLASVAQMFSDAQKYTAE